MQRCNWDMLKRRPDVRKFLEQHIWLPQHDTRRLEEYELFDLISHELAFGFVQCDVHVPLHLQAEFADLPPIFKNCEISINDVGETMKAYALETGDLRKPGRSLI